MVSTPPARVARGVHGLHGEPSSRRDVQPRSRRCIFDLLPGLPARGISSRGNGLPSSVAMKPSVPEGP